MDRCVGCEADGHVDMSIDALVELTGSVGVACAINLPSAQITWKFGSLAQIATPQITIPQTTSPKFSDDGQWYVDGYGKWVKVDPKWYYDWTANKWQQKVETLVSSLNPVSSPSPSISALLPASTLTAQTSLLEFGPILGSNIASVLRSKTLLPSSTTILKPTANILFGLVLLVLLL